MVRFIRMKKIISVASFAIALLVVANSVNQRMAMAQSLKSILNDMVTCPAGTFVMGSPESEPYRKKDEIQHEVTISKEFKIGKYEVTQELYEKVMGTNPSRYIKDPAYPVQMVTWEDAKNFCAKLNLMYSDELPKGYIFDLPTEAQWEYACRAGTTTAFNNDKDLTAERFCPNLDEVGWYIGSKDKTNKGGTHPVGKKKPNAWGIYDMHGNVAEWCVDCYGSYPTDKITDPLCINSDMRYIVRGGTSGDFARSCRSANRYNNGCKLACSSNWGFRLALVPIQSKNDIRILEKIK